MSPNSFGSVARSRAGIAGSPRRSWRRGLAAIAATLLVAPWGAGSPFLASAAPGTPGVPQAGTVEFTEDFENATPPQLLTSYTGASGMTYTADNVWLTGCDGTIINFNTTDQAGTTCTQAQSFNGVRQMAWVLGSYAGAADPTTNSAVTAFTELNPGAGLVQMETVGTVSLPSAGRFIEFSIDIAADFCSRAHPLLQFELLEGTTVTPVGSQVDACTIGQVITAPAIGGRPATAMRVGTARTPAAILTSQADIGVRMRNNQANGNGNDASVDNLRIMDVTPQLDKSFSTPQNGTSTLTITITNTDELHAKTGWSFDDTLPAGLESIGTPTTTCPQGTATISGTAGAQSLAVTGDLDDGMASCTVTVTVRPLRAGTFTNGPSNVSANGVNQPADTSVTFSADLTMTKTADPATVYSAGTTVTYTYQLTNNGNMNLTGVGVTETTFTGTGTPPTPTCPVTDLAPGASTTCTATYTVTQADIDAGGIDNTATATAADQDVESSPVTARVEAPTTAFTLTKSVDPTTATTVGTQVTYSFLVTNTGETTITGLHITEGEFTGTGTRPTPTCPVTELAPGTSTTCTATYTLTQADVGSGTAITNTATAGATGPDGTTTTSASSTATLDTPEPAPAPASAPGRTLPDTGIDPTLAYLGLALVLAGAILTATQAHRTRTKR